MMWVSRNALGGRFCIDAAVERAAAYVVILRFGLYC